MYDADFAHALRIIQEKSGCRVLLEPLTDKPPAIPAAAEPVPAPEPTPEVKPEPPATYMTVRDFALAAGCSTTTVYHHLRQGGLTDFQGKIDGKKAVNSVAMSSWRPIKVSRSQKQNGNQPARTWRTKGKPLYCRELDKTFPSILQAAKLLRLSRENLSRAITAGKQEYHGYHFTLVDDSKT